jgi:hypothetical protein
VMSSKCSNLILEELLINLTNPEKGLWALGIMSSSKNFHICEGL